MNNGESTNTGLIIGIILGILILGGIFLYIRNNDGAPANDNPSLDVNVKLPTEGGTTGGN